MLHPLILRFPAYSRAIPQEEQAVVAAISRMIASRRNSISCGLRGIMSSSDFSAQNSYRIDKGKSVWIDLIFLCGLMLQYCRSGNHWSPDGSLDMASNHKAYHKLPVPWQPLFPWKLLFTWSPISVWGRITGKIPRQAGSTPTGTPSCPHKDSFPGWVARNQWYYQPIFSW